MQGYRQLSETDPPVAFLDCVPLGAAEAIVIAALWGLEDTEERPTRLLHIRGERVEYVDVPANLVSVCRAYDGAMGLSKSGLVFPIWPEVGAPLQVARLRGGTMLQLRDWGDMQFACGMNGQVYASRNGSWSAFDAGLYSDRRSVDSEQLRDIGGLPGTRLLTIGTHGSVHEYHGRWLRRDLPTSANLEQLCLDSDGQVWIAGANGLLIRSGDVETWDILESGTEQSFWGISAFGGELFVSSLEQLWRVDRTAGQVTSVDADTVWPLTTYRLRASETDLWSIGPDDVARFDGQRWHRISIPSNDVSEAAPPR